MARSPVSPTPAAGKGRLGDLRLVWEIALRYPRHIAIALAALATTSAATIGIPMASSG